MKEKTLKEMKAKAESYLIVGGLEELYITNYGNISTTKPEVYRMAIADGKVKSAKVK